MTQIGSAHPEHWYNLAADFPEPMPPALNPVTREPLAPADLEPLFPRALIAQAYSGFNSASDPDLIESYVFEINALQARYSYLLRRVKELDGEAQAQPG